MKWYSPRILFLIVLGFGWLGAFSGWQIIKGPTLAAPLSGQVGAAPGDKRQEAGMESNKPELPRILLSLVIILIAAKIGGDIFERIKQPAVLGELVLGVLLGNLSLAGFHALEYLKHDAIISVLAEIGVVLLLFEVGLESNVKEMLEVGRSSFLVALFGVIAPLLLGWGVSSYFLPEANPLVHIFIGATLTATSVGLTARVLRDLGKHNTKEARIILGAAVIDDVMGLVLLASVSGIIASANRGGGGFSLLEIGLIVGKAVFFLLLAVGIGQKLSPWMFKLASLLRVHGMLLVTSISFCFLLSFLSSQIGLAPIVGAFAAGLILDPLHYEDFKSSSQSRIEELINPLTTFLVPVFFVLMGLRVNLLDFANSRIMFFAGMLSLAAILGKQACALGVVERGLDRISVGVGMIPRGEVGLIFASIGSTLILNGTPVINPATYSAVVIMVILSTLVTPPLLKITLSRGSIK